MSINEELKRARKRAGFTQKQVYEQTGITDTTLSNWETGLARPDVDSLAVLCRLYKVSPNEIYQIEEDFDSEWVPRNEIEEIQERMHKSPGMRSLFSLAKNATPEDLKLVEEMLKRMKKDSGFDGPED